MSSHGLSVGIKIPRPILNNYGFKNYIDICLGTFFVPPAFSDNRVTPQNGILVPSCMMCVSSGLRGILQRVAHSIGFSTKYIKGGRGRFDAALSRQHSFWKKKNICGISTHCTRINWVSWDANGYALRKTIILGMIIPDSNIKM